VYVLFFFEVLEVLVITFKVEEDFAPAVSNYEQ